MEKKITNQFFVLLIFLPFFLYCFLVNGLRKKSEILIRKFKFFFIEIEKRKKTMENEKSKKADFGKHPLESFDKLNDYFKDILSHLENYESYVQISFYYFLNICQAPRKTNKKNFERSGF
jgi:hypothetical protein